MRRLFGIVLAGLVLAVFCSYVLAQDVKESSMKEKQDQSGMAAGSGMMKKEGMKKHSRMMKMFSSMTIRNMVATGDGGVIVLVGNKLQKYDKNLVLKKEVEIKINEEEMMPRGMKCSMKKACMKTEEKEAREGVEPQEMEE